MHAILFLQVFVSNDNFQRSSFSKESDEDEDTDNTQVEGDSVEGRKPKASRYFVTLFVTLEEVGKKFYKNFTSGPYNLNTVNELIKRSKDYEKTSTKIFKANQRANEAIKEQKVAEDRAKQLEKEKTDLEARVKELEGKMETISKEKTAALEEVKTKDKKIKNLQVQWIDLQGVEDKEVILGNLRDAVETILETMKEVPTKEKKMTSFTQLADQVKGDYERVLKEHRDDFELFKASLLSETAAPTTSSRSSS
ncbi:hypothetical protein R1sor_010363 [Riccia sorocarpa]|uniref:Uncharacterized protein n=1 Tax=Riccia sorocarpa TaxID=122646 RepID=A0ABD3HXT8_9MARC